MDYITTAQAAQKWGISANQVFKLIRAGRIPRAVKVGSVWMIPENEEKPLDGRTRAGRAAAEAAAEETIDGIPFRYPSFVHRDLASFNPPLSPEELRIKDVTEAFHACRLEDADELLADLPDRTTNRYNRISALYLACMLDFMFVRTASFASNYKRLHEETSKDFPHNREMREFVRQVDAMLGAEDYYLHHFHVEPDYCYHESFLPRLAVLSAIPLAFAQDSPTAAELNAHETNCKLLEECRAYGDLQTLHLYLATGYALSANPERAKCHFAAALELTERYELYYSAIVHYQSWAHFMEPALLECSPETVSRIKQLCAVYQKRYITFMEKSSLSSIYTKLPRGSYMLLYYAAQGYTNKEVANALYLSPSAIGKRYSKIYSIYGVKTKKDLARIYHSSTLDPVLDSALFE